MKNRLLLLIFFVGLFTACKTHKNLLADELQPQNVESKPHEITTYFFEMRIDPVNSEKQIELTDKVKGSGILKPGNYVKPRFTPYLIAKIYNDSSLVEEIYLEHPLYKHIEYVNEEGGLEYKYVELESGDFSFRLQSSKYPAARMELSEYIDEKQIKKLYTLNF